MFLLANGGRGAVAQAVEIDQAAISLGLIPANAKDNGFSARG